MPWPPQAGELLPRYDEPVGIEERLRNYSLNFEDDRGWAKANGFLVMLGIDLSHVEYLELEIRRGVSVTPIASVRSNHASGYNCVVDFPIVGPGDYGGRVAKIRTIWGLTSAGNRPHLVSAFLRGREKR